MTHGSDEVDRVGHGDHREVHGSDREHQPLQEQAGLGQYVVKAHMRRLYDKLGVNRRLEAVEQACAPGLLAPSPRGR
jgi:hypothetical protein